MIDIKTKRRLSMIRKENRKAYIKGVKKANLRPARAKSKKKYRLHKGSAIYAFAERSAKNMIRTSRLRPNFGFNDPETQSSFEKTLARSISTYIF